MVAFAQKRQLAGRPSNYSPAYAGEVITFMEQGLSLTSFAGYIGVSKDSVYHWMTIYPEFSDAVQKAKAKRVLKVEKDYLETKHPVVAKTREFILRNADPDEWADKRQVEHSGTLTLQAVLEESLPKMVDITPEVQEIQSLSDLIEDK